MNTIPCKECVHYYELTKARRSKRGGTISLHKGHCLAKTIYASNKIGPNMYPPNAKAEELPNGMHKITIVRESSVKPNCTEAKQKR